MVDRVVTYLDPQRGAARLRARLALFGAGGYTGARTDRAALKDFNPRIDSADSATIPDLPSLRSRHRDLIRNGPIAASAVGTTVVNAVGVGLFPVPGPDAEYLGISDQEAADWAARAYRLWWHWAGGTRCDIGRRMTHAGQQRLACRSQLESGDVFVLRRFRRNPGDVFGLKLQFVEADRVSTPSDMASDENVVDGVQFDGDGAPSAFHVAEHHPGDRFLARGANRWTRVRAYDPATGEPEVIHLFDPLRPGQSRGVPLLAACIERLKQSDRSVHAEQMAQVIAGMIVYSVETPDGDAVPQSVSQGVGEMEGDTSAGQLAMDYGAVLGLAAGEKLTMHSANRPGTTWEPFQAHIAREVGAAIGIPAGVLLHWFSKSYSASRGEWMLAWKHWAVRRDRIAYDFSGTVYGWLIEEAVARGYLSAPGFFDDPLARAAWLGCEWRGAPAGQLDPLKEIAAIEKRRALQISTLAQDTAEITGGDWEANLRQLAIEQARRLSLGLPSTLEGSPAAMVDVPDQEEDE
jgi:lambda family phage portal protein